MEKQKIVVSLRGNEDTTSEVTTNITNCVNDGTEIEATPNDEVDGPLVDKVANSFIKLAFLKILLLDIFISVGDIVTDILQSVSLIWSSDWSLQHSTLAYGVAVLVFMWLPGIVAVLHFFTHTRYFHNMGWKKSIPVVMTMLLVFPLIPTVGYFVLLFKKRRFQTREEKEKYNLLETRIREIKTIAGAVESPLQVTLLLWLMLRGTVYLPWEQTLSFSCIQDQLGNLDFQSLLY